MTPNPQPKKPGPNRPTDLLAPDNYPLAYYNMPKAACTTIKNILYRVQHGKWHPNPLSIHRNIRYNGVILRGAEFVTHRQTRRFDRPYTVFTFVRNPGPRVYSTFVEKIWASGPYAFPKIRQHLAAVHDYSLNPLEDNRFELDEVRTAFKQFLRFARRNLAGKTRIAPNPHWASQYKRLLQLRTSEYATFIGRVESFEQDMSYVLQKAGWKDVSISRTRFNEGPKPPFSFQDVLDDEIAAAVSALFEEDYLAFDYAPPAPNP